MRQSQLFTKTRRDAPKGEEAKNAQLLIRAGYVHKEIAGVYDYLPLGLRVIENIKQIVREEMNAIGGQELSLTALQEAALWQETGRFDDSVMDVWFKTDLKNGTTLGLAATHEEPITRMMRDHIASYRDLPQAAYQFQTKFRNELRAKSGIMRGREFLMKDLYSFAKDEAELDAFYEQVTEAYRTIFRRAGIGDQVFLTFASGGSFSKYSHEFQALCEAGEDTIFVSSEKGIAVNEEVLNDEVLADLGLERESLEERKAIEVGNIFKLGTRFSEPLSLRYRGEDGSEHPVVMGSYGIGIGRLMGTIVELLSDEKGIVWPASVAPFDIHLVSLVPNDGTVAAYADALYEELGANGSKVLYDDRDMRAGEKLADSDLIGIPVRIIIGKDTIANGQIEVVERRSGEVKKVTRPELMAAVQSVLGHD